MCALILTQCCCCYTLRTGTLIIGYIYMISSLLAGTIICWEITEIINNRDSTIATEPIIPSILLFHAVSSLAVAVLLLIGTHKDNSKLILVWIISTLVLLLIDDILFIITGYGSGLLIVDLLPTILYALLVTALNAYFVLVVYSYYDSLKARTSSQH